MDFYRFVLPAFLLVLLSPAKGLGEARLVNFSQERQAVVLRDARGLQVLARDQIDSRLQVQLQRVDAQGADIRFLDLPDGELVVRLQRGADLDQVRASLLQRPVVPKTIEVAIPLDPATGQPLTGPVRARPTTPDKDPRKKPAAPRPQP